MTTFTELLQQGTAHAWLFMPSAILLGALHGLEPGHSKTMMAAFIVAIHGTVRQAVLLGLSATISHTAIVWIIALAGLHFGGQWNAEATEPYFQLATAVIVICVALWMLYRTRAGLRQEQAHHHAHDHHHSHEHHHAHAHEHVEYQDAHERAHADDIRRRFTGGKVTTAQIIAFGLTGGLIPCPASITVLLLCLQLKQFSLGLTLVLCFSIGLALTMVASGTLAALSLKRASQSWSGWGTLARRAPYLSGALMIAVGIYTGVIGWIGLAQA